MAKAFFGVMALLFIAMLWVSVPRGIRRDCPVCQGTGSLPADRPIFVGKGKGWEEKDRLLCPFCDGGRISLYELKQHRSQMLQWMVKRQKLPPDELQRRVKAAFGSEGLEELHRSNFYLNQN